MTAPRDVSSGTKLAKSLGVASIALGAPSLLAPRSVEAAVGVRPTDRTTATMRAVGVQEMAVGTGILLRKRPAGLLWSRVAGDITHLTLLARALATGDSDKQRVRTTMAAVAGITLLDVVASLRMSRATPGQTGDGALRAKTAITVRRAPEEVYAYWRELGNLPQFMYHLDAVEPVDGERSHWVAKGPAGTAVEWDAEVTQDVANELIAWRSVEGATVANRGEVRFAPAPQGGGTEVRVELEYSPPGGAISAAVARLFGEEPNQQLSDDLRRFKQVLETGEVVVSDASPDGTRTQHQLLQRDAQPLSSDGS